ncbi:protealysin inhibitor emfourin [Streptomyces lushanensis]|uniref:protealysin inhibitor emfourin n=1 Tax=Streptomyces lushanensis TaxID=1434255 RepID=UPI00082D297B|nr:protealysin inhibitor emfourin [Streptomyces lushanensis]
MRIEVRRTGGFAGIERRAEVDTSHLSDAPTWRELAEQAMTDATRDPGAPVVPDGFSYRITVDDHEFRCADPHLSESQRTLISRVLKEGA